LGATTALDETPAAITSPARVEAASSVDRASQIAAGRPSGDGRWWTPPPVPGGVCLGRRVGEATETIGRRMLRQARRLKPTKKMCNELCAGVFFL
jgi:hypothetical protein